MILPTSQPSEYLALPDWQYAPHILGERPDILVILLQILESKRIQYLPSGQYVAVNLADPGLLTHKRPISLDTFDLRQDNLPGPATVQQEQMRGVQAQGNLALVGAPHDEHALARHVPRAILRADVVGWRQAIGFAVKKCGMVTRMVICVPAEDVEH